MAILVDSNTRIIVQGITGREAASFTKDMMDYGSKVMGGVTPGKGGWDVMGSRSMTALGRVWRNPGQYQHHLGARPG